MTRNHRNRSWRAQWTVHPDRTVAEHKSGFRVISGPQGTGFDRRQMLRPQDDFQNLYRRGLQLLDEMTGRRPLPHWITTAPNVAPGPEPEVDPEIEDDGPEMGR